MIIEFELAGTTPVKSAAWICVESITTGTAVPSRNPCLLITARTYSTLGNTRLRSGVMTRYSQPLILCISEKKIICLVLNKRKRTFASPHWLHHLKLHHKDDRGNYDGRQGSLGYTPPSVVFTPDEWLTAPRLRPPLTGIDDTNDDTMLHAPNANIS
ncbi:hypothetical protein ALC57_00297 [Trachymyrmex cornetzi]|uniref:Uncharacterized protein n=1 Tax=Trachymyrmex cornetzi TaxID=471704 RepID=A0A151JS97_9HYME|nr:hypothetical protein ALC57_00297 [Trachymyrmex cornetzi]